jgi:hypothetical protein
LASHLPGHSRGRAGRFHDNVNQQEDAVKGRLISLTGIACAVAALALAGPATAAPAGHAAGPAVSGTEHFQLVSTSAAGNTGKVIAYGAFTGAGVDHMGNNTDKFVFKNGSFKVHHKNGKGGTQKFNPKTCLAQITQPGTYRLSGGTGKYAGISGHGKFRFTLLFIGARNAQGKCAQNKPPVASQLIIRASGPVRF